MLLVVEGLFPPGRVPVGFVLHVVSRLQHRQAALMGETPTRTAIWQTLQVIAVAAPRFQGSVSKLAALRLYLSIQSIHRGSLQAQR